MSLDQILISEQEEGREVSDNPGQFENCPENARVSRHRVLVRVERQKGSLNLILNLLEKKDENA